MFRKVERKLKEVRQDLHLRSENQATISKTISLSCHLFSLNDFLPL